jgi:bifunctional DNA-binding transcriptional regulator/antitoxin component of YhaV-PrlF toxin-antitoxin module
MRDVDTVTVTERGQAVLPLAWRKAHGLDNGGPCDAKEVGDGKGSLLLTPRPQRKGAKGLLRFIQDQEVSFAPVERHTLPTR